MKKIVIATAALTLMCGSAFAQTSNGPAAQGDNMTKPGMTNDSTMKKDSMDKGTTTGMTNDGMKKDGMSGDGMKKDMSKQGGQGSDKKKGM
jgi:pentapeptide MXKDX repeat protein